MLSRLLIDKTALRNNLQQLSALSVGADAICVPVLKANAYGHGLQQVFECLHGLPSVSWIAVNYIEAARQLRSLGFGGRILIVGPTTDANRSAQAAQELDLDLQAYDPAQFDQYSAKIDLSRIHIKIDTGLGRQGSLPDTWKIYFAAKVSEQKTGVMKLGGMSMHFANVEDVQEHSYAQMQRKQFENFLVDLAEMQVSADRIHSDASSSHILFSDASTNFKIECT